MSTVEDWWEDVYEQIVTQLIAMDDFDNESVFFGERWPPEKFPSAYVVPTEILGGGGTVQKEDYDARFEIVIVINEPDMKKGIVDSHKLAMKVKAMFIADRSLSELLDNLEASVHRHWRGTSGYEDHWVHVLLSCKRCM